MKRRNFLKGLLGVITLPIVVKASITEEINNSLLEIAQYEPMTATEVLNRQEGRGSELGKRINELNKISDNTWKAYLNGKEIPIEDVMRLDGAIGVPSYIRDGDLFKLKSPYMALPTTSKTELKEGNIMTMSDMKDPDGSLTKFRLQ